MYVMQENYSIFSTTAQKIWVIVITVRRPSVRKFQLWNIFSRTN